MTATPDHLEHATEYVRHDLATAVEGALWSFEPLRTTKSLVDVKAAADGSVVVAGNVRSEMMRNVAGRLARGVPGVTWVTNDLVSDSGIEAAVARLLGAGEVSLFTGELEVRSRLGLVYLGGVVRAADKAAAEAAVRSVGVAATNLDGVHEVVNQVRVVEGGAEAAPSAAAEEPPAGGADQMAIQERLRVWRERAAAKGA